jgi:hypothetical protein
MTEHMRLLRRRSAAVPLDEAAAYARCHGTRANEVRIVTLPPRRRRYDVLADGELLRQSFERLLDAREGDELVSSNGEAGSEEPASTPPAPPAV